jgi:hypothetical protein
MEVFILTFILISAVATVDLPQKRGEKRTDY